MNCKILAIAFRSKFRRGVVCSTVEPSVVCNSKDVSTTTDRIIADDIVAIVVIMRKTTTAAKRKENGLVFGSTAGRPDFPGV